MRELLPTREQINMTEEPSALPHPPDADADRRRWPRAGADWPIRLLLPEGHFEARVRDVSRAGICFFLDRPIPEMTSLRIDLELPVPEGMRFIRGDAVVVRCDKISDRLEHYEIAAFLNNMADPDRDALESFVDPLQSDQSLTAGDESSQSS
jgi:hypothetical protein